jgi:protein SCO1/2
MKRFAIAIALILLTGCNREPEPMIYYPVPDFSLQERSGRTVTLNDLAGKVWIADFIFTNCAGTCPLMTERMRKLQDTVPAEVRMVSFTVDPSRDTTGALAAYAAKHGADENRWLFLTGEKQALFDLSIKGFKLALLEESGSEVEPITHSTRFVLVDRQGRIRGYYSGIEDEELKRLADDLKKLL